MPMVFIAVEFSLRTVEARCRETSPSKQFVLSPRRSQVARIRFGMLRSQHPTPRPANIGSRKSIRTKVGRVLVLVTSSGIRHYEPTGFRANADATIPPRRQPTQTERETCSPGRYGGPKFPGRVHPSTARQSRRPDMDRDVCFTSRSRAVSGARSVTSRLITGGTA